MPNQRQKGTKLAGAYVPDEKDAALTELALAKGYSNKAEFIRALFDEAIETHRAAQSPKSSNSAAKSKPRAAKK